MQPRREEKLPQEAWNMWPKTEINPGSRSYPEGWVEKVKSEGYRVEDGVAKQCILILELPEMTWEAEHL